MDNIKLNRIDNNFQLNNKEKRELKGGTGDRDCCCGCLYEGQGGSTSSANALANYYGGVNGLKSKGCPYTF